MRIYLNRENLMLAKYTGFPVIDGVCFFLVISVVPNAAGSSHGRLSYFPRLHCDILTPQYGGGNAVLVLGS